MSLHYESPKNHQPSVPDHLAHAANNEAVRRADLRKSREALQNEIRVDINHPNFQKLLDASRSRRIPLYCLLTLAFILITFWEWHISREMYEIWFPYVPLLPFFCCVAVGLYISACLSESSTHFSLLSLNTAEGSDDGHSQDAIDESYDHPWKGQRITNWVFSPFTGVIVALLFLTGIYLASQTRVEFLRAAEETPDVHFQLYLPVVLYNVEILLGMPTVFFLTWAVALLRMRKHRKTLTQARDYELVVRQSAIKKYTEYMARLGEYNQWAERHGRPQRSVVPANRSLRNLLTEEFGHDPIQGDDHHNAGDSQRSPRPSTGEATSGQGRDTSSNLHDGVNEDRGEQRVQDLLNLIDEQIDDHNHSL
jgi:hypothetical protein